MGNSPRYVGFLDPPYSVTLTEDSGKALDLTGCTSNSFTLTMLNADTGKAFSCVGVWTIATPATAGQASYQWTANDMATAGNWKLYTTVKLPAEPSPREFDPETIQILPGTVGAGAAPAGVLPNPTATLPFLNIRDYGGIGDNASDNTTSIYNARAAARALGGARILYGPGTFLSGNQDISNDANIYHVGSGRGSTILKLKNGANTDLFSAQTNLIDLFAVNNTSPIGTLHNFGFSNMTIDGNKANQFTSPSQYLALYTDTFGSNSSAQYGTSAGGTTFTWDTANHRLTGNGGSNTYLFYAGVQRADGYGEVVLDTATGNAGITARYLDRMNNYILYIGDASAGTLTNTVDLCKWVNGGFTNIQSVSINFVRGTPHTFRLQTIGSTITVLMDGTQIIQVTDTSLSKPGYFGLMAQNDSPAFRCSSFKAAGGLSYPCRWYGSDYIMENLEIANGYSGNVLSDWNASTWYPDSMESQWSNVKIHDSGGIGLQFGGPHDSTFNQVDVYLDAYHDIHIAPNAITCQFSNGHCWEPGPGFVPILSEATSYWSNWQTESSDTAQWMLLANGSTWNGGNIFGGIYSNTVGVKFGQGNGDTPYYGQVLISNGLCTDVFPSHCQINTRISGCQGFNGGFWFYKDGGHNDIRLIVDAGSGSGYTGALGADNFSIVSQGVSPTNGGFASFAGGVQVASASTLYSGSGVPSNSLGSNGDFYFRIDTPGTANQRLYVKSVGVWVGIL